MKQAGKARIEIPLKPVSGPELKKHLLSFNFKTIAVFCYARNMANVLIGKTGSRGEMGHVAGVSSGQPHKDPLFHFISSDDKYSVALCQAARTSAVRANIPPSHLTKPSESSKGDETFLTSLFILSP